MCIDCGCGTDEITIDGHSHHHAHDPHISDSRKLRIEVDILAKNNEYAAANRNFFAERSILALNLVSSPGSGKTTLLTRTLNELKSSLPIAVIEGDQQTANDADRIRATGVTAVQINTGKGCHLDADMIQKALLQLKPAENSTVFIF